MKELSVELAEGTDRETVERDVETALQGEQLLWLTDRKGRRVGVPAARVAYVEFSATVERNVGFGTA
jgi:hypothetical protein